MMNLCESQVLNEMGTTAVGHEEHEDVGETNKWMLQ